MRVDGLRGRTSLEAQQILAEFWILLKVVEVSACFLDFERPLLWLRLVCQSLTVLVAAG